MSILWPGVHSWNDVWIVGSCKRTWAPRRRVRSRLGLPSDPGVGSPPTAVGRSPSAGVSGARGGALAAAVGAGAEAREASLYPPRWSMSWMRGSSAKNRAGRIPASTWVFSSCASLADSAFGPCLSNLSQKMRGSWLSVAAGSVPPGLGGAQTRAATASMKAASRGLWFRVLSAMVAVSASACPMERVCLLDDIQAT